jgi:hypothetical protein
VIEFSWRGVDGSIHDLTHGPLRLTAQALEVLMSLTVEGSVDELAYVDGQTLSGTKAAATEFPLQVATAIPQETVQAWTAIDAAWKRSIRAGKYGQLLAAGPGGDVRALTARMKSEKPGLDHDQSELRRTNLIYVMVADDPWWYGETKSTVFGAHQAPPSFYGPRGFGPPFYLAAGSVAGAASVSNPGDEDAWPVWTFYGPTPRFSAVVDGERLAGDFAIRSGDYVTIDTHPTRQAAITADGTDVTDRLSSFGYAPVPPGDRVPVQVLTYGQGMTRLDLTPRYERGMN